MNIFELNNYHKNHTRNVIMMFLFGTMFIIPSIYVSKIAILTLIILLYSILISKKINKNIEKSLYNSPLNEVHLFLIKRYKKIMEDNSPEMFLDYNEKTDPIQDPVDRIYKMLCVLEKNIKKFPPDKTSRWIGYIQYYLIDKGVTTIDVERNVSRPYFHEAYRKMGYDKVNTVQV